MNVPSASTVSILLNKVESLQSFLHWIILQNMTVMARNQNHKTWQMVSLEMHDLHCQLSPQCWRYEAKFLQESSGRHLRQLSQ